MSFESLFNKDLDIDEILARLEQDDMEESPYDETPEPDDIYHLNLRPGLEDWEIEEARILAPFSRGLMLITGEVGAGKGTFANPFAWKMRRYFQKPVGMDYMPRKLFDDYYNAPKVWNEKKGKFDLAEKYFLFDENTLMKDLRNMHQVAMGQSNDLNKRVSEFENLKNSALKTLANKWIAEQGIVRMQNSVLVLDELWKYVHNRDPHNKMGRTIAGIIKIWRHLDLLMIGMAPRKDEIDVKACLRYITHEVRCEWMSTKKNTTKATIYPVRFITSRGNFNISGKPFVIYMDGGREREFLGGKRYFDMFNSKNAISLKPASMTG